VNFSKTLLEGGTLQSGWVSESRYTNRSSVGVSPELQLNSAGGYSPIGYSGIYKAVLQVSKDGPSTVKA